MKTNSILSKMIYIQKHRSYPTIYLLFSFFTHSWRPTIFHPEETRERIPTLSCNPCPVYQALWTTWGDRKDLPAIGYCSPSSQPYPPWNRYRAARRAARPLRSTSNNSSNRARDCFYRIRSTTAPVHRPPSTPASPPCNRWVRRSSSHPSPSPSWQPWPGRGISRFAVCSTRSSKPGSCARSRWGSVRDNIWPSLLFLYLSLLDAFLIDSLPLSSERKKFLSFSPYEQRFISDDHHVLKNTCGRSIRLTRWEQL